MTQIMERGAHDAPRRTGRPRMSPDEIAANVHSRGQREAMEWWNALGAAGRGDKITEMYRAAHAVAEAEQK